MEDSISFDKDLSSELIRVGLKVGAKSDSTKDGSNEEGFLKSGDVPLDFEFGEEEGYDDGLATLSEEEDVEGKDEFVLGFSIT